MAYTAGMKTLRRLSFGLLRTQWHRLFGHADFTIWTVNGSGSTITCRCGTRWLLDDSRTQTGTSSVTIVTALTDDHGLYDHQAIP